jgi:hypothetical protein
MINAGAAPIKGDGTKIGRWLKQVQYGSSTLEIVDAIIAEWQNSGTDPTYALWFGLPKHYVKQQATD